MLSTPTLFLIFAMLMDMATQVTQGACVLLMLHLCFFRLHQLPPLSLLVLIGCVVDIYTLPFLGVTSLYLVMASLFFERVYRQIERHFSLIWLSFGVLFLGYHLVTLSLWGGGMPDVLVLLTWGLMLSSYPLIFWVTRFLISSQDTISA